MTAKVKETKLNCNDKFMITKYALVKNLALKMIIGINLPFKELFEGEPNRKTVFSYTQCVIQAETLDLFSYNFIVKGVWRFAII